MNNFWKYAAIVCFSALCGLLTGEYLPNRNIATKDDLAQFSRAQALTDQKIDLLALQQSTLLGELKGKGVIAQGGN